MEKYIELFDNPLLSDLVLELVDYNSTVLLPIHKNIMYVSCSYFKSMFGTFNDLESKKTIQVKNARITRDIIGTFYGKALPVENYNYMDMLDLYLCRDFLGFDFQSYKTFDIPTEYYNNLIKTIDTVGYTNETIKILANNIPTDYDISQLSIELLEMLVSKLYKGIIYFSTDKEFYSINLKTKVREKIYSISKVLGTYYFFKDKLAIIGRYSLEIIDINTKKKIHKQIYGLIDGIIYSEFLDQLIILINADTIIILNCNNFSVYKDITDFLPSKSNYTKIKSVSTDGKYIALVQHDNVYVLSVIAEKIISVVKQIRPLSNGFYCVKFSPIHNNLVCVELQHIDIYSITTNKLIKSINIGKTIDDFYLLPSGNIFIITKSDDTATIWDYQSEKIVHQIDCKKYGYPVSVISDTEFIFSRLNKLVVYDTLTESSFKLVKEKFNSAINNIYYRPDTNIVNRIREEIYRRKKEKVLEKID